MDNDGNDKRLVQLSPDEFADRVNDGYRKAYQGGWNRAVVLLVFVLLWGIGLAVYRHFWGGP